jgi:hypothetical protein
MQKLVVRRFKLGCGYFKLERVDLVITDTPAFRMLNEEMKAMKQVVKYRLIWITVYFTFTVPELWPFFS